MIIPFREILRSEATRSKAKSNLEAHQTSLQNSCFQRALGHLKEHHIFKKPLWRWIKTGVSVVLWFACVWVLKGLNHFPCIFWPPELPLLQSLYINLVRLSTGSCRLHEQRVQSNYIWSIVTLCSNFSYPLQTGFIDPTSGCFLRFRRHTTSPVPIFSCDAFQSLLVSFSFILETYLTQNMVEPFVPSSLESFPSID